MGLVSVDNDHYFSSLGINFDGMCHGGKIYAVQGEEGATDLCFHCCSNAPLGPRKALVEACAALSPNAIISFASGLLGQEYAISKKLPSATWTLIDPVYGNKNKYGTTAEDTLRWRLANQNLDVKKWHFFQGGSEWRQTWALSQKVHDTVVMMMVDSLMLPKINERGPANCLIIANRTFEDLGIESSSACLEVAKATSAYVSYQGGTFTVISRNPQLGASLEQTINEVNERGISPTLIAKIQEVTGATVLRGFDMVHEFHDLVKDYKAETPDTEVHVRELWADHLFEGVPQYTFYETLLQTNWATEMYNDGAYSFNRACNILKGAEQIRESDVRRLELS